MITAENRLRVIEDFQVDRNLLKFKMAMKPDHAKIVSAMVQKYSDENRHEDGFDESALWNPMIMSEDEFSQSGINLFNNGTSFRVTIPTKTVPWYRRWFAAKKEPAPTLSVEDFFGSVKNSAQEISIVQSRAAGYEAALLNAKKAGQQALYEKLAAGLNAFKMETQLHALGLTRFINEEDIVRFYKQAKKGLRLDWIRNFTRPIPEDVTAKKVHADELGLFDNYCVLHYDPGAKSYAETQAEKAARKDPILFGLMKGRTQLYFVGDWIDETCDLTLDQFAEILGAGAVQTLKP